MDRHSQGSLAFPGCVATSAHTTRHIHAQGSQRANQGSVAKVMRGGKGEKTDTGAGDWERFPKSPVPLIQSHLRLQWESSGQSGITAHYVVASDIDVAASTEVSSVQMRRTTVSTNVIAQNTAPKRQRIARHHAPPPVSGSLGGPPGAPGPDPVKTKILDTAAFEVKAIGYCLND